MGRELSWEKYEPEGIYIAVNRWGKDHWSTLAYAYTRAIDHSGRIENSKLRTNPRLHRCFAHSTFSGLQDGSGYPTRLTDGVVDYAHDDWSCLEDACDAGFIELYSATAHPHEMFGSDVARVVFLQPGIDAMSQLFAYKARGGSYAEFVFTKEEPVDP